METQRTCPNCQKPLAPAVPLGLCPECLIKAGFPSGVGAGGGTGVGAGAGTAGIAAPPTGLRPGTPGPLPFGTPVVNQSGRVSVPAVGLIITGVWKLFSAMVALLLLVWPASWLGSLLPAGGLLFGLPIGLLLLSSTLLFHIIPGLLIVFGGIQMLRLRSHAWAVTAAILAILVCGSSSLLGIPMGIWALIVLSSAGVRDAFNGMSPRPQTVPNGQRGGNAWLVVGVVLLACFFLFGAVAVMAGVALKHLKHDFSEGFNEGFQPASSSGNVHQDINLSYALSPQGSFSLDNVNGKITIIGWDQNQVVIKGVKSGSSQEAIDAVKTEADSDTNDLAIHTRQPSKDNNFSLFWFFSGKNSARVDYTVEVPRHARLKNIEDINGQITISGLDGDINASTVNGGAAVQDAGGSLQLETVNGHISAQLIRLRANQTVKLTTVNGAIDAILPAGADATVSADTVNGGIASDFATLAVTRDFPISSHLTGSMGQGTASLHAETVNGGIHFARAP